MCRLVPDEAVLVLLLARLELAYSLNEGVQRIWENILAVLW